MRRLPPPQEEGSEEQGEEGGVVEYTVQLAGLQVGPGVLLPPAPNKLALREIDHW